MREVLTKMLDGCPPACSSSEKARMLYPVTASGRLQWKRLWWWCRWWRWYLLWSWRCRDSDGGKCEQTQNQHELIISTRLCEIWRDSRDIEAMDKSWWSEMFVRKKRTYLQVNVEGSTRWENSWGVLVTTGVQPDNYFFFLSAEVWKWEREMLVLDKEFWRAILVLVQPE